MVGDTYGGDGIQLGVHQGLDVVIGEDVGYLADIVSILVEELRGEVDEFIVLGQVDRVPDTSDKVLESVLGDTHT